MLLLFSMGEAILLPSSFSKLFSLFPSLDFTEVSEESENNLSDSLNFCGLLRAPEPLEER